MAREFVRGGRLTWWGWLYLTLAIIALGAAAYFFANGSPLGGGACLMSAIADGSFIYTGWKNNKASARQSVTMS
jgi:hypothetical protein